MILTGTITTKRKDKDGSQVDRSASVEQKSQHNQYGFDPSNKYERDNVDVHRKKEQDNVASDRFDQVMNEGFRHDRDMTHNVPVRGWESPNNLDPPSLDDLHNEILWHNLQIYNYEKEAKKMAKKGNKNRQADAEFNAQQHKQAKDQVQDKINDIKSDNSKNRDARRNRKPKDYSFTDGTYKHFAAPGNDFAWWNKFAELMKDILGLRPNHLAGTKVYDETYLPGLLEIKMFDTYGFDSSPTDGLNVVVRDLFLKLFQKYRGVSQYQASDLGMTIIAGCEVIKTMTWIERVYGIINRYSKTNYNIPILELAAMGISTVKADKLRKNLAQFRSRFNVLISKAQRLCLPKDLSFISYIISTYGGEFLDHDSDRAQLILYNPTSFGKFRGDLLSTGSCVDFESINVSADSSRLISITETDGVVQFDFPLLDEQLDLLLGNDDVQRMFGDLLAWFGAEQMVQALPIPENYVVMPSYAPSILHKLHNTYVPTGYYDSTHFGLVPTSGVATSLPDEDRITIHNGVGHYIVHQNNNVICTKFSLGTTLGDSATDTTIEGTVYHYMEFDEPVVKLARVGSNKQFLDGYHMEWNDEFVCEGLMVKPMFRNDNQINNMLLPYSNNIGICLGMSVYTRSGDLGYSQSPVYTDIVEQDNFRVGDLLVFDWYPLIYAKATDQEELIDIYSDIDMFRQVDAYTKAPLDRAIVMSAFKTDITVIK